MTVSEKVCTKCKLLKPVDAFGPNAAARSGLKSWCKSCNAAAGRERYAKDPQMVMQINRKWAIKNPEQVRSIQARYDTRHPERHIQPSREAKSRWARANPDKVAEKTRRRRARKNAEYDH